MKGTFVKARLGNLYFGGKVIMSNSVINREDKSVVTNYWIELPCGIVIETRDLITPVEK